MKFCNHDTSGLSTFRFTKIAKVLILLFVVFFSYQNLFSQHVSRDNYKGDWENPGTWDPAWASPSKFISGYNITINGYVTSEGSLSFYNLATLLIVNDTLIINGNLYLHNNNDLIINDAGILIVRGDFYFDEHSLITSNGYFIITGDIQKDNDHHLGSFKSNDNPPKVFVGGSASPSQITNNFFGYPVLNCNNPVTIPYPNSGCSSGNMDDLKKDPIYPFFQSTCNFYVPSSRVSVCPGDSILLAANGGENYNWKGPAGFGSNLPNPCLTNADSAMSGIYTVYITADHDCEETDTINVLVNAIPAVSITSSDDILCLNTQRTLTGMPAGGRFELENGTGSITANVLTASGLGEIKIKYIYSDICTNTDTQKLVVNPWIPVDIRSSDDTLCIYEKRTLKGTPLGGMFDVVKGPGLFAGDTLKPTDTGEIYIKYIFNNVCSHADSQVIVVNPLIDVSISSSDDTLCFNDQRVLTGIPAGGTFKLENGPGLLTGNTLKALNPGEIVVKYLYNRMCANTASQTIISIERAESDAGENQELRYVFETTLAANIHPRERGTWKLVSGSGNIQDINSPESRVTGLSLGENVFLWTVSNGACESESEISVIVLDLVIPSVFTPNDDGINDNFYIPDYNHPFELTVLNQWGLIEYESHSYIDHWDGINNKGNRLPPETYFYILKFENGQTKKGTVLIIR
jgi:gliding motility-associated-like protein